MPGKHCAVAVCENNSLKTKIVNPEIIYHSFPSRKDFVSEAIKNEWVRRCHRADKLNPATSQICSIHYTPCDYERDLEHELLGLPVRKNLKKNAVPTLHLQNTGEGTSGILMKLEQKAGVKQRDRKKIVDECYKILPEIPTNLQAIEIRNVQDSDNVENLPTNSTDFQPREGIGNFQANESSDNKINWELKYKEMRDSYEKIKKEKALMSRKVKLLNSQLKLYKSRYQYLVKHKRADSNVIYNFFSKNQMALLMNKKKRVNCMDFNH